MKILTAAAIFLIVLVSFLFLFGLFSDVQTAVGEETIIEAPLSVPMNLLAEFGDYHLWTNRIKPLSYDPARGTREVEYRIAGRVLRFNENVRLFTDQRALSFDQADGFDQSYLRNIRQRITLKALPDGTTGVRWTLEYEIPSITGRLLNPWLVAPKFRRFIHTNLSALKDYIER